MTRQPIRPDAVRWILIEGETFELPTLSSAYVCLIWATCQTSLGLKWELASRLITSGCRYIVSGGAECEIWHDVSDEAYVYLTLDESFNLTEETLVVTSWHEDETIEEVTWFMTHLTGFDERKFDTYLIVQVGQDAQVERELISSTKLSLKRRVASPD